MFVDLGNLKAYQSLHRTVQRMSMVSPELGICAFERWVAVGLGFLDAVVEFVTSVP